MQKTHDIEILEENIFKNDLLDRKSEIENLTPIVLNFNDPLVLALDSPWGTGKTTFVKLWQAHLKKEGKQAIYFNAWETDFAEDPLIVLVSELDKWVKTKKNSSLVQKWTENIGKTLPNILKRAAVAGTKAATLGALDLDKQAEGVIADLSGGIASDLLEQFNKQSKAIEQFKEIVEDVLKILPDEQKNLVIFIDELDRCRPTYAIELLERIKHLFSIERLVFVLSTDTTQLSHSICAVYGNDFDAKKYLQRFIDLDYSLKETEKEKYIGIQFEKSGINQDFQNRNPNKNDGLRDLTDCFYLFSKRFDLKLRDINILLMRIRLILYAIPNNHFPNTPLLTSLLILRDKNKELYDEYLKSINSPSITDKVISFLLQGYLPLKEHDYISASIIGYLIAASIDSEKKDIFNQLIEPYKEEVLNVHKSVIAYAKNPRGSGFYTFNRDSLNLTVERIELVHRINL